MRKRENEKYVLLRRSIFMPTCKHRRIRQAGQILRACLLISQFPEPRHSKFYAQSVYKVRWAAYVDHVWGSVGAGFTRQTAFQGDRRVGGPETEPPPEAT